MESVGEGEKIVGEGEKIVNEVVGGVDEKSKSWIK